MELFGMIFGAIGMMVLTVIIAVRFLRWKVDHVRQPFVHYLVLSLALGILMVIASLPFAAMKVLGVIVALWFFAWVPVSAFATFYAPPRWCVTPILYIGLMATLCACTALFINEGDVTPPWVYCATAIVGVITAASSLEGLRLLRTQQPNPTILGCGKHKFNVIETRHENTCGAHNVDAD